MYQSHTLVYTCSVVYIVSIQADGEEDFEGYTPVAEEHEYTELIPQKRIPLDGLKSQVEEMKRTPGSFKSEYEVIPLSFN